MPRKYTPTPQKILKYLTTKQASKWDLSKELDKSYTNIRSTVVKLLEHGYITVSEKKPSEKNPNMQVEYYRLTLKGLAAALRYLDNLQHLDVVARCYKDKLLTFQEWETFKKFGAINEIQDNLTRGRPLLAGRNHLDLLVRLRDKKELKDSLDSMLLGVDMDVLFLEKKNILQAVNRNEKLHAYVVSKIKEDISNIEKSLEIAKGLLAKL